MINCHLCPCLLVQDYSKTLTNSESCLQLSNVSSSRFSALCFCGADFETALKLWLTRQWWSSWRPYCMSDWKFQWRTNFGNMPQDWVWAWTKSWMNPVRTDSNIADEPSRGQCDLLDSKGYQRQQLDPHCWHTDVGRFRPAMHSPVKKMRPNRSSIVSGHARRLKGSFFISHESVRSFQIGLR